MVDTCNSFYLVGIYLLKVNNRNTRTWWEICSKLTTPERRHWRRSGVFIVNFEHISHLVLLFLLLTLSTELPTGYRLAGQFMFTVAMESAEERL